jgi:membrane glycosyltransferase
MRFWQLGESHYWGHNAILRMEPFLRHCAWRRSRARARSPATSSRTTSSRRR